MDAFRRRGYLAILGGGGEDFHVMRRKDGKAFFFFFNEFKTTLGHLTYGHVKQLGDVNM